MLESTEGYTKEVAGMGEPKCTRVAMRRPPKKLKKGEKRSYYSFMIVYNIIHFITNQLRNIPTILFIFYKFH
jgi:hypothetical protein